MVVVVKGRENVITKIFRNRLHEYLAGIVNGTGAYSLAVNGYLDHVHLFFELPPTVALSDLARIIKTNSSKWINEQNLVLGKFAWQSGYAAFSYARSQRNIIINYIQNQEEHHKKKSFKKEYLKLLATYEIDYDNRYLFEFYE
jgi:REP element-mobilizing transposase RayT